MDYTNFSSGGSTEVSTNEMRHWWKANDEDLPNIIQGLINYLHSNQSQRMTQLIMGSRLYGNLNLMGLNGLTYSRMVQKVSSTTDRLTYNVIQSAIDTVTAKIGKNRPKALFLTSGGDYRLQQKAKNLSKFVDGIFYENGAYDMGPTIFRDACVWGTGITHVYDSYNRVKHERVLPHECYVDEIEAYNGNPRSFHRVKNVDRSLLMDMFPNKKQKIKDINQSSYEQLGGYYQNVSDLVFVRESWHLPSGPEAKDGLHCITVDNGILFKEQYDRDHFPFAFFSWNPRIIGFWGQSAVEEIQNIQLEINKLLWVLQRSYNLAGSFKVLLENGSKIVKEHLTNDVGAVINYTGTPPQYIVPPIVPTEYYQHLESLIQKAFSTLGVSQLSAASLKPQGLDSGKALREYNDIESDRFMTVGHQYEKYFLDLSKLSIACAKGISEESGNYEVDAMTRNATIHLDWSKVDLEQDEYVMKAYPISSLPDSPEGKLQTIQEYMQAGLMSPRTGRRLLDFPDLEQVEDLQNAAEEYLNEVLEKIVEEGIYTAPEPYDDLSLALELGLEYYARGKHNGLEEEKLELIRQFIDSVKLLQGVAASGMAQQGPGAPQASPMPPPQSDLIPNVPIGTPQAA